MEENFSPWTGWGIVWGWFKTHYISCAFYFYFYYISSISDPQALDPGGWVPALGLWKAWRKSPWAEVMIRQRNETQDLERHAEICRKTLKPQGKRQCQGGLALETVCQRLLAPSSPSLHDLPFVIGVYELWGHYTEWNESDRKTNTIWSQLYVESKKKNLIEWEYVMSGDWLVADLETGWGWGGGANGWRSQKIPTSNYKIHQWWGYDVQHGNYS